MSDKRFFKVMAYAFVNSFLMSLFIDTTPFEFVMFLMVSTLVFERLVSKEEAE